MLTKIKKHRTTWAREDMLIAMAVINGVDQAFTEGHLGLPVNPSDTKRLLQFRATMRKRLDVAMKTHFKLTGVKNPFTRRYG